MALNSTTVAGGDSALATDYNELRLDVISKAGEYAIVGGTANVLTLSVDAQYVAYTAGDRAVFEAASDNTAATTINVNSIGAKTIKKQDGLDLVAGDFVSGDIYEILYDGTNFLLQTPTANPHTKFGGTGADGDTVISSNTNIDASSANIVTKNYKDLTVNVSRSLTLINPATDGTVLHIKVAGDLVLNGTIDASDSGADGGAGGAGDTGGGPSPGSDGTISKDWWFESVDPEGNLGTAGQNNNGSDGSGFGGGGGSGATHRTNSGGGSNGEGNTPGVGGASVAAPTTFEAYIRQYLKSIFVAPGAGGGGGGGGFEDTDGKDGGAGGAGGKGAGSIIFEVAGNITFGASSTIDVSGAAGANGSNGVQDTSRGGGGGGGGGGGAGGQIFMLHGGTLTDNGVTKTITGGAAGTGGLGGDSDLDNTEGGDGGAGGDGDEFIEKNTNF